MTPFTKREKILTAASIVLLLLVLLLSFKLVDSKIFALVTGGYKYSESPSMDESIKNASMIFLCKTEIEDGTAKYRISDILYKDRKYDFPFEIGDLFPRLQRQVEQGMHYGEGRVIILSTRKPIVFQSPQIMRGKITSFDGISVDDFIQKVKSIKP